MKIPQNAHYGTGAESGEKEPKGVTAGDTAGERKTKVPMEDSEKGKTGYSGEKEPKGSKASDASGEHKSAIVGGVGMGKMDSIGARDSSHLGRHDGKTGEMNDGKHEGSVYRHQRTPGSTHK
jgi:hypothetical protein